MSPKPSLTSHGSIVSSIPSPSAEFIVSKNNLGNVAKGDVIHEFVTVTNTGTTPLRLQAHCGGCRSPQLRKYRDVVPPGQTELLAIQIRSAEPGTHKANVEVFTDDPENATLAIDYTYTVVENGG
ncbi:Ig-like domain-containing protein [Rubripirellula tenax]|nr:DUF1573 domain-containing protein [Rubripirellula tenax]